MKKNKLLYIALIGLLAICGLFFYFKSQESGTLEITKQPEDVIISYPEGASFTVEVNKPRLVKSYQWMMVDVAGNEFELSGVTAKTKKLVIPSTLRSSAVLDFYCIITDKNDEVHISETASLDKDNSEENKPVLYLGEYAIEPGQTLDLTKVDLGDGTKLGSGVITYDANGTDITLDNVVFDNKKFTCDYSVADNVGLVFDYNQNDKEEYNVTFIGDNVIYNDYYDPDYNASGIPFDFMFTGEEGIVPLVNLIGDGNLTITNGTYALRVIGDLMIDIDLTIKHDKGGYGDGVVANHTMVAEGTKIDMDIYGTAFSAKGNLYLKGSDVSIKANAPHISMGMAAKNTLNSIAEVRIEDSNVDIDVNVNHDVCQSVGTLSGISCGPINMYNSSYSFDINVDPYDELYVSNIMGISASEAYFEDSKLNINIDSKDIFSCFGIYSEGNIQFVNSDAKINTNTNGLVYGAASEIDFSVDESNVDVTVSAFDDFGDIGSYGVMCENFVARLLDANKKVNISNEKGLALGCSTQEKHNTAAQYTSTYQAKNIYLRENTICSNPKDNIASLTSIEVEDINNPYLYLETFYDLNDVSAPAKQLSFTAGN